MFSAYYYCMDQNVPQFVHNCTLETQHRLIENLYNSSTVKKNVRKQMKKLLRE